MLFANMRLVKFKLTNVVCWLLVTACTTAHGQTASWSEFMSGRVSTYNTAGNPKAKGIELTFDYPRSWGLENGKRPNMLVTLASEGGRGLVICGLEIRSLPVAAEYVVTQRDIDEFFLVSALKDFTPSGSTYIGGARTTIDGQPAAWIRFIQNMDHAGMKVQLAWVYYLVYFDKKSINLACSVGGAGEESAEVLLQRFQVQAPLFQQMASSMIIQSKWNGKSSK